MLETQCTAVKLARFNIQRGKTRNDRPPLADAMAYVESGLYPPPELMLALRDAWHAYLVAGGTLELEVAFLGERKQKGGTYAKRTAEAKRKAAATVAVNGEIAREVQVAAQLQPPHDGVRRTPKRGAKSRASGRLAKKGFRKNDLKDARVWRTE